MKRIQLILILSFIAMIFNSCSEEHNNVTISKPEIKRMYYTINNWFINEENTRFEHSIDIRNIGENKIILVYELLDGYKYQLPFTMPSYSSFFAYNNSSLNIIYETNENHTWEEPFPVELEIYLIDQEVYEEYLIKNSSKNMFKKGKILREENIK